jgi:hypothetical protein
MLCALHTTAATQAVYRKKKTMDPKLTMLVVLFGAIIGLSHLRADHLTRLRQQLAFRRWRKTVAVEAKF